MASKEGSFSGLGLQRAAAAAAATAHYQDCLTAFATCVHAKLLSLPAWRSADMRDSVQHVHALPVLKSKAPCTQIAKRLEQLDCLPDLVSCLCRPIVPIAAACICHVCAMPGLAIIPDYPGQCLMQAQRAAELEAGQGCSLHCILYLITPKLQTKSVIKSA